jgi:hypothetical protein
MVNGYDIVGTRCWLDTLFHLKRVSTHIFRTTIQTSAMSFKQVSAAGRALSYRCLHPSVKFIISQIDLIDLVDDVFVGKPLLLRDGFPQCPGNQHQLIDGVTQVSDLYLDLLVAIRGMFKDSIRVSNLILPFSPLIDQPEK